MIEWYQDLAMDALEDRPDRCAFRHDLGEQITQEGAPQLHDVVTGQSDARLDCSPA